MNFTVFIFSLIVGRRPNKLQTLIFNLFKELNGHKYYEIKLKLD